MSATLGFVGRVAERRLVADLLADHPVVTLCGPGGVGKTRLGSEVADEVAHRFPGGVWTVELSAHSPADDIAAVAARQLGVASIEAFRLRCVDATTLVVLDNCESALAQAADVAAALVSDEAEVRVLATSREPLRVVHERVVGLDPLALPASDDPVAVRGSEAVQLFLQRAESAGAPWPATNGNLVAAGHLVSRLDGLPLAIELAAARSRALSPPQLVELLDRRLDVLVGHHDGAGRHRSLRAAIAASYEPLDDDVRRFFRTLAVVGGTFDLELAGATTGTDELVTLERLTQLVDCSLVAVRVADDGRTAYRLLDSIRAFGLEELDAAGEAERAYDRFVDAMVAVADRILDEALRSFSPAVLDRIQGHHDHLVAAISWCLAQDETPQRAHRLFLPFYGPVGARAEVVDLAARVRARWPGSAPLRAEVRAVMGTCSFLTGDVVAARELAAEALADPAATPLATMIAHRTIGFVDAVEGDTAAADVHLRAAIEAAEDFSASFGRELTVSWAATVRDLEGEREAVAALDVTARRAAEEDELITVMWAAVTAALHHHRLGDGAAARRAAEAALTIADRTGLAWSVTIAHRAMAGVEASERGWTAAAPHYRAAFERNLAGGDVEGLAATLKAAAGAARFLGHDDLARQLWSAMPPARGVPVLSSIFADQEDELLAELGPPTTLDVASLVPTVRRLLGPLDEAASPAPPAGAAPPDEASPTPPVYRFAGCELDTALQELRRGGERVHIEPQVYDVLHYLIERRGNLVTKGELLDNVWGDRFVSEAALSSRIAAARRATGDDGKTQSVIRTVHGRGFVFVADLT